MGYQISREIKGKPKKTIFQITFRIFVGNTLGNSKHPHIRRSENYQHQDKIKLANKVPHKKEPIQCNKEIFIFIYNYKKEDGRIRKITDYKVLDHTLNVHLK